MTSKFVRQDSHRHFRLGRNNKKKQVWRRPRGRHSKMRKQRKSYPASPTVGYKSPRKELGKINSFTPILVHNLKELKSIGKNNIPILAKIGARKKLELIKYAEENKIKIHNVGGKAK
jgi:large subunit ribosomal protein L32e